MFDQEFVEIGFGEDAGAFEEVAEFADVAGVVVRFEDFDLFGFEAAAVLFEPVAVGDLFDIALVFAERGDAELYHIHTVK